MRRVLILLLLIAAVGAAYYATRSKPTALVLTGIVTTEDVIVAPQVGGRIGQVLVKEGDEVKRDQLVAVHHGASRPDQGRTASGARRRCARLVRGLSRAHTHGRDERGHRES